jgi:hypothetical protein
MLPIRRPLPLFLLVLTAGTSGLALAGPQHQREPHERRAAPPPASQARPERAESPRMAPPQMRAPRQDRRRERNEEALSDSIRRVERNTRGRVLSAERVPYDGRSVNRIKVVDDRGRVRIYMDDPQQAGDLPTRGDDD